MDRPGSPSTDRSPAPPSEAIADPRSTPDRTVDAPTAARHDLAGRLILSEENERRRISEGLHDEIGQSLALLRMRLSVLESKSDDAAVRSELASLADLTNEIVESTRSLTFDLSSPVLYRLGLVPAIENLLDRLAESTAIGTRFECLANLDGLAHPARVLVHRCVRELLRNVERHAEASTVAIRLRSEQGVLEIEVEDDGVGFDPDAIDLTDSFGLFSLEQSLALAGGSIEVDATLERGTCVRIRLAEAAIQ